VTPAGENRTASHVYWELLIGECRSRDEKTRINTCGVKQKKDVTFCFYPEIQFRYPQDRLLGYQRSLIANRLWHLRAGIKIRIGG